MNRKVSLHSNRHQEKTEFVKRKPQTKNKGKWTLDRKRKNRIKYNKRVKAKKQKRSGQVMQARIQSDFSDF